MQNHAYVCYGLCPTNANAVEQRLHPVPTAAVTCSTQLRYNHQSAENSCAPAVRLHQALHTVLLAHCSDKSTVLVDGQRHGCPQVFTDASSSAVRIRNGGNGSQQCVSWQAFCYANATSNVVLNVRLRFDTESSMRIRPGSRLPRLAHARACTVVP